MKKLKRILALTLALLTALTCISCDNSSSKGIVYETASSAGAPDYSESTKKLNMYAFLGPTSGSYVTANGISVVGEDNRTKERYQEYKDCGFDVLLLLGNDDLYEGSDRFTVVTDENKDALIAEEAEYYEKNRLNVTLDICNEIDLKAIVFDDRVHQLTMVEQSIIKEDGKDAQPILARTSNNTKLIAPFDESVVFYDEPQVKNDKTIYGIYNNVYDIVDVRYQFENEQDLQNTLSVWMSAYSKEECFYGMSMFDEPGNAKLKALGQVDKAIEAVKPGTFVQTCLLPYYGGNSNILSVKDPKAFTEYVNLYLDETQSEYFGYDFYPMLKNGDETTIMATYLNCLQMSAEMAKENKVDWEIIIQTYAQSGALRKNTEADVDMQVNLALAFGAYNIGYFTYWMWENIAGWTDYFAIMDSDGSKLLYDEVKKVNSEAKELAKIILNYKYEKTKLTYMDVSAPVWYKGVVESELDNVKSFESNGNTLVNQMYDAGNDCRGYMIVNVSDPANQNVSTNTITFDGYDNVMLVRNGVTNYYKLNNGSISIILEEGESAFLIPYNN